MPKGNTNTANPDTVFEQALADIPVAFRKRIVAAYLETKRRYREGTIGGAHDATGLSVGKFCEAVFRLLQHNLTGSSVPFGQNIPNFADGCRALISLPSSSGPESLRIILPRALAYLYTMRGKRGIGHVGGDIEANRIDTATIVRVSDWIVCELIRVFHRLPLEEAQAIIDSVAVKDLPVIWEVGGRKRVLRTDLNYKQKVLLLLYASIENSALAEELFDWSEHASMSHFRRDVLRPMHVSKLIEYDHSEGIIYLSPLGIAEVEGTILRD